MYTNSHLAKWENVRKQPISVTFGLFCDVNYMLGTIIFCTRIFSIMTFQALDINICSMMDMKFVYNFRDLMCVVL